MPVVELPLVGQSYKERSVQANAQACVNLYAAKSPTAEKPDRVVLYPTPGYELLQDLSLLGIAGTGPVRGQFEVNGFVYLVSGSRLLKATPAGAGFTYAAVGTLYTSTGRCSIVCNTVELAVSDGANGYVYHLANGTFQGISGGAWPAGGVTNFAFQDSYVLAAVRGTSGLVQSGILQAGSFPFQAAVGSFPDALTAVHSDGRQLYCFGPKRGEVRFNTGSTRFSFEKVQGAAIEAGCVSWATMQSVGGSLLFLAADEKGAPFVAALDGYTPRRVSHGPLNEALQRAATVSDAYATAYREGDASFYCLTVPALATTWCYEAGTGSWHERKHKLGKDLAAFLTPYRDKQLAGGEDGKLYWMSQEYLTDGSGSGPWRSRTCSHVSSDGNLLFVQDVEVDLETGFSPGDPKATLEFSSDRGVTWRSCGVRSIGATGETDKRLVWRSVGYGRHLTFRVTVSDPARVYLLGARMRVRKGTK